MNEESTKLQALQVKQQLGIQALSIANASSQTILRCSSKTTSSDTSTTVTGRALLAGAACIAWQLLHAAQFPRKVRSRSSALTIHSNPRPCG